MFFQLRTAIGQIRTSPTVAARFLEMDRALGRWLLFHACLPYNFIIQYFHY
jgi:hypothetical protein